MYFIYIIHSHKSDIFYIGFSTDIAQPEFY